MNDGRITNRTRNMTIRWPLELVARAERLAADEGIKLSQAMVTLFRRGVEATPEATPPADGSR